MSITPSFAQAEYIDTPAINAPATPDTALFVRAVAFGLVGVLVGAIIDGGFIGLTHISIGYLAIGVAWLVAKAMITGSRGQGGRFYQVTAVLLTYLSLTLAHAGIAYFELRKDGAVPLSAGNIVALLRYGVEYPILRFKEAGPLALLGLLILFYGLRAAWRMTSGDPADVRHPFAR